MATANLTLQNFFSTTLSSGINATDTTIPLNALPSGTEGFLVIEPDNETAREIIYYTSKTGSAVLCPSAGTGRGQDGTTATSHSAGATVKMTVTAGYWRALQDMSAITAGSVGAYPFATGWGTIPSVTPSTITYNGNRSYDLVFNSTDLTGYISPGMRLRTSRTVAAPTQCTSLNGTTQHWVKTTPNKLTFTDDFVVSAWIKISSYGSGGVIVSRYNGTSGWDIELTSSGQVLLAGFNGGASNVSYVLSYQSVPLNKWVHITAQLDMSSFTATSTTSYIMFDGKDVPCSVARGGTNPTALVQAGNLEIGSRNGGLAPFGGKIAQVAIFNAKVTQSTMQGYISQGLSGSETSLASAYSFNNSTNDLNTSTPNDLSAGAGSPTATNADSPFAVDANGTPGGTYDYAIVQKAVFSTNTTLTVQVPEGCAIPTSGGVSAVAYSSVKAPFGMPVDQFRWSLNTLIKTDTTQSSPTANTWYNVASAQILVPTGAWRLGYEGTFYGTKGAATIMNLLVTLSTGASSQTEPLLTAAAQVEGAAGQMTVFQNMKRNVGVNVSTATQYYLNLETTIASSTTIGHFGNAYTPTNVEAIPSNL